MTAHRHLFDGELLTVAEIQKRVPCYGDAAIRKHLREGRTTRAELLNFNTTAARQKAGRAGAKAAPFQMRGGVCLR